MCLLVRGIQNTICIAPANYNFKLNELDIYHYIDLTNNLEPLCIKYKMSVPNSVFADSVTTLMVHVLIDGNEILPHALRSEDVTKGVLMSWTHVEPRDVHALNETIFLVTYSSGILADDTGSAIEKIDELLGKPVVITCDEVTTAQLPNIME